MTDDGVKHLTSLKQLNVLSLRYCSITDVSISYLTELKQINTLYLSGIYDLNISFHL